VLLVEQNATLALELADHAYLLETGYVVTSGTISSKGSSLFPRGIAIGQVSWVGEEAPYKTVEIHPLANLRGLETVQVLTAAPGSAAKYMLSRFAPLRVHLGSGIASLKVGPLIDRSSAFAWAMEIPGLSRAATRSHHE